MAKKPVKQEEKHAKLSPFINYTLTDEERKQFQAWKLELGLDELNEKMEVLLDKGFNFSVKWDNYNDCYSCFIISPRGEDGGEPVILTGRGKSALSALSGALFRHFFVFEGFWPVDTVVKRGTDDD